jgi:DNA modification methylase
VAQKLNCKAIGIELNPEYIEIARRRLKQTVLEFEASEEVFKPRSIEV